MSKKYVLCFFFICIIVIKFIYIPTKYNADSKNQKYIVMIEEKYKEKEDYVSYIVKLGKENNSKFKDKFILNIYKTSFGKVISQKEDITKFEYGDCLKVTGKISIPEYMNNPGEFNYKNYLYSNNIYGIINTYSAVEKVEYSLNFFEKVIASLNQYKEYMSQKLDNRIDTKYSNVLKGIIYGEKIGIEEEIKENFKVLGVSHILSVSGSHISSVIFALNLVFFKLKDKRIKGILKIFLITIYVIIFGMGISSIRAYLMILATIISDMKNKKVDKIKTLILAFLIILFFTPYAIFNLGFRLSFLATLGITLFLPLFNKFKKNKLKNMNCKIKFLKFLLSYILDSVFLTISVQIMILPIEISSLNSISLLIVISNFVFGIFTMPVQVIGSIYMLFSYVTYLDNILIFLLKYIVQLMLYILDVLAKRPYTLTTMSYPIIFHLIYYILVLCIYLLFKLKSSIKVLSHKLKYKWRKIKILSIICIAIYIFSIVIYTVYIIYYSSFVYFFNVGQGEMSYIKAKDKSVIIDIGSVSNTLAGYTISNYFKSQNVSFVDMVILTHMHSDHVNGFSKLLEICKVGKVIYVPPKEDTDVYNEFLSLCKKYDVKICEGVKGDKYKLGDITIEILSPGREKIQDKDYINTNSLICKVSVNEKNMLYMADATHATEKYLLNSSKLKDIEIIKVAHHGSKNGSLDEFIEKVKPRFAVISAKKKYYNHPHENTIETLKKYNVHILITENIGAIKFNMYNLW